jgi:phosphopantetheine attachment domain protein
MQETIKQLVISLIKNEPENDTDLFSIGLDSLSVLQLIVLIENEFNVNISDDDLILDNLRTIMTITHMVEKYV